jgi:hypothetical protein
MSLARYFVFPRNAQWIVALDGAPIAVQPDRRAAVSSAIVMADLMGSMHHDADVLVEDEDGKLKIAWTFGRDALPARETTPQ